MLNNRGKETSNVSKPKPHKNDRYFSSAANQQVSGNTTDYNAHISDSDDEEDDEIVEVLGEQNE